MIRRRLTVRGLVQGVGFRPFVYRLAQELALNGWVRNDAGGVTLEVQGTADAQAGLLHRLRAEIPPLARIDHLDVLSVPADPDAKGFTILASDSAGGELTASIGPDTAVCPACLAELFDPANRRYRYAFINCTDCGPRYTITRCLPYDRAQTSMARFSQCPVCLAEYTEPAWRRFHAEPNACPDCGPQLALVDASGRSIFGDPVAETLVRIRHGEIVAIKGLGGFHLVCDARNAAAVGALRERKQREEKPLALMLANVASCMDWVEAGDDEIAELTSRVRPIVLLRKKAGADEQLAGVAPGLAWLGVMLPCTPLHYLLFHEAAGSPSGLQWLTAPQPLALVMTSANPHGEPLVTDNAEALKSLQGIADAFLLHDRDIVIRCDDSVLRRLPGSGGPQFIRRARGYTPCAIPLSGSRPDVLALGGFYKNTLCFTRGDQAFLSQHIGDLDRVANCRSLEAMVEHMRELLDVRPHAIAHDLHPDFFSTQLAQQLAERWQVPAVAVQHHHAHIGAVLAEHKIDAPVLGLALDGIGFGSDGAVWGGELLLVDGAHFERLGHLRPIGLPGWDRAAREPWRMGAAALALLGRQSEIAERYADEPGAAVLVQMLERGVPQTTSMGRYFDAVAGLLGIQPHMRFEGQAAMRLEGLAERYGRVDVSAALHGLAGESGSLILDLAPLLQAISSVSDAGYGAAVFHAALVPALADWVEAAADSSGIRTVACGGGCFLNALLAGGLRRKLEGRGIGMLEARLVPPGDGGLALGQAWVAQRTL